MCTHKHIHAHFYTVGFSNYEIPNDNSILILGSYIGQKELILKCETADVKLGV
jgi:hypothetical protein